MPWTSWSSKTNSFLSRRRPSGPSWTMTSRSTLSPRRTSNTLPSTWTTAWRDLKSSWPGKCPSTWWPTTCPQASLLSSPGYHFLSIRRWEVGHLSSRESGRPSRNWSLVSGYTWKNDAAHYDIPRTHQHIQYDSNKLPPGEWSPIIPLRFLRN